MSESRTLEVLNLQPVRDVTSTGIHTLIESLYYSPLIQPSRSVCHAVSSRTYPIAPSCQSALSQVVPKNLWAFVLPAAWSGPTPCYYECQRTCCSGSVIMQAGDVRSTDTLHCPSAISRTTTNIHFQPTQDALGKAEIPARCV
jgi:hypothetical protein